MVTMKLKGLFWTQRFRKDGSKVVYYYAWRGGPLIHKCDRKLASAPPEMVTAFHEAHRNARSSADGFLAGLVEQWRASPEWDKLAPRTQADYRKWLDEILKKFATLPIEALDDRAVRQHFIKWRNKWATKPRQADHAITTLKALLTWSVKQSIIEKNHAQGIGKLYTVDKSDQIWTLDEIEVACKNCSTEVGHGLKLMAFTGLRLGDAIALRWDQVKLDHIERPTNKSGGRRVAFIPILPETRALLDSIPRRAVTVLTTTRKKPWAKDGKGLSHAIGDAARAVNVDRNTHDLRRTFATRLAMAGLPDRDIAEIMGWSIESVAHLRRVYVDRGSLVISLAERLANKNH